MTTDIYAERPLRIGIIAGEASGDILGAGLIRELSKHYPTASFEGLAGPEMIAAGCWPLYNSEEIAVMGLFEVLKHLPRLLKLRKSVVEHFLANPPDVFIGIDSPDFNLNIEERLRAAGIKTVHYVSPSIWAWRQKRIFTVKRSADLVLCLFPFETQIYHQHDVAAVCVGHPLADLIPDEVDKAPIRQRLGLQESAPVLAVLPGSRAGELKSLGLLFLRSMQNLTQQHPNLQFVVPLVNPRIRSTFEQLLTDNAPELKVTLVDGQSRDVMAAADVVLLASGTATLEALLLKKPMVVSYQLAWLSYLVIKLFGGMKIDRFALPNLLGKEDLAPELIQADAKVENLVREVNEALANDEKRAYVKLRFQEIHNDIRRNASEQAAAAVMKLLSSNEAKEQP